MQDTNKRFFRELYAEYERSCAEIWKIPESKERNQQLDRVVALCIELRTHPDARRDQESGTVLDDIAKELLVPQMRPDYDGSDRLERRDWWEWLVDDATGDAPPTKNPKLQLLAERLKWRRGRAGGGDPAIAETPVPPAADPDELPYLEKDDVTILESLARRGGIVAYQADISELGRDRVSDRLKYLLKRGYVQHPDGKSKGWLISQTGMKRLSELPALDVNRRSTA